MIIQDQILSLLLELQRDFGMSMVLVSHDLGVIAEMCDRIAVMYGGQIVELADARTLLTEPRHPYTISLLRSLPDAERRTQYLQSIPGTPPRLVDIQPGLPLRERGARCANHRMPNVGDRAARRRTGERTSSAAGATTTQGGPRHGATAELRVGVIGAGRWANMAHLPGWKRDERCRARRPSATSTLELAEEAGRKYDIAGRHRRLPRSCSSGTTSTSIDVVTGDQRPLRADDGRPRGRQARARREAGRARLPRHAARAADLAAEKGLKTKVGFTFRYSPAVRYMKELIDEGWVGTPYIYNAYEQNSQWIDPQTPLRQAPPDLDADRIRVSSLEGYGAPVIDLGHWFMDDDLTSVVGVLRNFVPERMIRETGTMMRANIDDGDMFIGEFARRRDLLGAVAAS